MVYMVRTQIYLTENERTALRSISTNIGKKQSELIRDAIDYWIDQLSEARRKRILDRTAGMWKERTDLPNFGKLRKDWDRTY